MKLKTAALCLSILGFTAAGAILAAPQPGPDRKPAGPSPSKSPEPRERHGKDRWCRPGHQEGARPPHARSVRRPAARHDPRRGARGIARASDLGRAARPPRRQDQPRLLRRSAVARINHPAGQRRIVLHLRKYLNDDILGLVCMDDTGDYKRDPGSGAIIVKDPRDTDRVFVDVTAYNSANYYVEGAVQMPGKLPVTGHETVRDAIHYAGGRIAPSDRSGLYIVRTRTASSSACRSTSTRCCWVTIRRRITSSRPAIGWSSPTGRNLPHTQALPRHHPRPGPPRPAPALRQPGRAVGNPRMISGSATSSGASVTSSGSSTGSSRPWTIAATSKSRERKPQRRTIAMNHPGKTAVVLSVVACGALLMSVRAQDREQPRPRPEPVGERPILFETAPPPPPPGHDWAQASPGFVGPPGLSEEAIRSFRELPVSVSRGEEGMPPEEPPDASAPAKTEPRPEYVVEPPDLLLVEVLETMPGRPISGERLVRPDGRISLGFYGDIPVAGLTLAQVKEIVLHLRKYLNDRHPRAGRRRCRDQRTEAGRVEEGSHQESLRHRPRLRRRDRLQQQALLRPGRGRLPRHPALTPAATRCSTCSSTQAVPSRPPRSAASA